uniref:SEA domain-containing protein n=1 Tax=Sphenodon punctatus TaxID=8508 RepID=A0A8D0H6D8_SPHPU
SSIGPAYIGCRVTGFRPLKHGSETGVDTVCTYRNDSATPVFDRVRVYHEVRNQTNGITKLGPYGLDRNSLYVNGYNEAEAPPTPILPTAALEHFTVNFTVTNLKYKAEMGSPDSQTFNVTERPLIALLDAVFKKSSIGPTYKGCEVTAFR